MGSILAVDPGTTESAYVIVDEFTLKPRMRGKISNEQLLLMVQSVDLFHDWEINHFVVEMVAGMGQAVGQETFDTAFWVGRFWQAMPFKIPKTKIFRRDEKTALMGTQQCKDKDLINVLVERYAPGQTNYGKGTDSHPGWFYGFKADIWQAYATAVTYFHFYLTESGRKQYEAIESKRATNKAKREAKKKNKKGGRKNGKDSGND